MQAPEQVRSRLIILGESFEVFFPLLAVQCRFQSDRFDRVRSEGQQVLVPGPSDKAGGVFTTSEPLRVLPSGESGSTASDLVADRGGHFIPIAVAPDSGCVGELGAQGCVRTAIGYAPRADIILVIGFAIDGSGVDVSADLPAADAFVIGWRHATSGDWVRVISK